MSATEWHDFLFLVLLSFFISGVLGIYNGWIIVTAWHGACY